MPRRVSAGGARRQDAPDRGRGRRSAILEYDNGATGHFITTTGEAPGTDRLEIAGDRGKIVAEAESFCFACRRRSVREFRETSTTRSPSPETWDIDIPVTKPGRTMAQDRLPEFRQRDPQRQPTSRTARKGCMDWKLQRDVLAGLTRTRSSSPWMEINRCVSENMTEPIRRTETIANRGIGGPDIVSSFGGAAEAAGSGAARNFRR